METIKRSPRRKQGCGPTPPDVYQPNWMSCGGVEVYGNEADMDSEGEEVTGPLEALDSAQALLDTWIGELDQLQMGLEQVGGNVGGGVSSSVQRREKPHPPRIDAHRFSRANLEDSGDVELDAILGELCALETQFDFEISSKTPPASSSSSGVNAPSSAKSTTPGVQIIDKMQPKQQQQQQQQQSQQGHYQQLHPQQQRQSHSRSNSGNRTKFEPLNVDVDVSNTTMARTDSPDNDSAFSDNVSMLSSESSASSGASGCWIPP